MSGHEAGHGLQPTAREHQRAGTCHPGLPGRADTAASDPTSQEVQLLRTTKQNKGARRGRSLGHPPITAAPSPEPRARSRPSRSPGAASPPGSPPAAHPGLGSPGSLVSRRPPVTGAGEAAEGQPGMGKPDGCIPPPSSSIPPSGCPRARPPSAGARGGRGARLGRAHPGEGLPLSKGHHPSAVPGLGLVPPVPRPRGWRWGAAPNLGR